MIVRPATPADEAALLREALAFLSDSHYRELVPADPAALQRLIWFLVEHGGVFVAERERELVGMLAAHVSPNHISGLLTSTEVAWWMNRRARGGRTALELLEASEVWARDQGAVQAQMIAPAGSSIGRLYERRGYVELETVYQKRLV